MTSSTPICTALMVCRYAKFIGAFRVTGISLRRRCPALGPQLYQHQPKAFVRLAERIHRASLKICARLVWGPSFWNKKRALVGSNARFRAPAHPRRSLQAGTVSLLVRGYFLQCTGFCSLGKSRLAGADGGPGPSLPSNKQARFTRSGTKSCRFRVDRHQQPAQITMLHLIGRTRTAVRPSISIIQTAKIAAVYFVRSTAT